MTRFLGILALLSLSSCGYAMRGDSRAFFEGHQIKTLYVAPAKNQSYKAGVEISIYNALRKRIAQGGYVRLVDNPELADAKMYETVIDAVYTTAATAPASSLASASTVSFMGPNQTSPIIVPAPVGRTDVQVTSLCSAKMRVTFDLVDKHNAYIWHQDVIQYKNFSNSSYMGPLGNTSALINASEFERALGDLSTIIVTDAEESLNTVL